MRATNTRNKTERYLSSNCHAFFAALVDLFGSVDVKVSAAGNFTRLRITVQAPSEYLTNLRTLYGGRVSRGIWTVEGEQAEAFAKAVKYFVPSKRRALDLFLNACMSDRAEGPLTNQMRSRRRKIVEKLDKTTPDFDLPRSFTKEVGWAPLSVSKQRLVRT